MSRVEEHSEKPRRFRRTRFVCISDTHNQTPKLPAGDVLLHAGDLTNQGSLNELRKTVEWLEKAPFEAKIVVAGNHDITLDENFYTQKGSYFHSQHPQSVQDCINVIRSAHSITYLRHESKRIRLRNPAGPQTQFSIFGSPFSPGDGSWAFQYDRLDAQKLWDAIPLDTDMVMTHTPPQNHCDSSARGIPDGCAALRNALWRVRPIMAVCGHRHEGRGAHRVRWKLDLPTVSLHEDHTDIWDDPGAGNNKQSLVDLSAKGRKPIANTLDLTPRLKPNYAIDCVRDRVEALEGRLGREETCVINAAIMARSYGMGAKRFNKPIVVDVDLPFGTEGARVRYDA
ncbi:Metallo-dependent phosphatase [Saccharata proteae CBS 121410]|uniref:Metallo-dependent phosphatase n=1 Tax=Saccharata proteae CBS 121410 TaxID=1314787 RepID=A0A9P4LYY6_9PEZI|nr:Metallo-dependent phosphatase [Saccharata proteae CBS 121410]